MTDEHAQELEEMEAHYSDLLSKCGQRTADLLAAVETHRRNIWGSGPVGHPEDLRLYEAAGMKPQGDDGEAA